MGLNPTTFLRCGSRYAKAGMSIALLKSPSDPSNFLVRTLGGNGT